MSINEEIPAGIAYYEGLEMESLKPGRAWGIIND